MNIEHILAILSYKLKGVLQTWVLQEGLLGAFGMLPIARICELAKIVNLLEIIQHIGSSVHWVTLLKLSRLKTVSRLRLSDSLISLKTNQGIALSRTWYVSHAFLFQVMLTPIQRMQNNPGLFAQSAHIDVYEAIVSPIPSLTRAHQLPRYTNELRGDVSVGGRAQLYSRESKGGASVL